MFLPAPVSSRLHRSLGLPIRLGLIEEASQVAEASTAGAAGAAGLVAGAKKTPEAAGRSW